jgi:hypothetical protein
VSPIARNPDERVHPPRAAPRGRTRQRPAPHRARDRAGEPGDTRRRIGRRLLLRRVDSDSARLAPRCLPAPRLAAERARSANAPRPVFQRGTAVIFRVQRDLPRRFTASTTSAPKSISPPASPVNTEKRGLRKSCVAMWMDRPAELCAPASRPEPVRDGGSDVVEVGFEEEVSAVDEFDASIRGVAGERRGAGGGEDLVVPTPDREHRYL